MSFNDYLFKNRVGAGTEYDWNIAEKRKKIIDEETNKMYEHNKRYQSLLDARKKQEVDIYDKKISWYNWIDDIKICNIL